MTFGSICSGIEAASVAWHPLGWKPRFFAEIAPFPSAVLKHRYPNIPNHGDFTTIDQSAGPVDVLVGGTPCQSFSVAGKRAGLDDPRGNLTLEFLALAGRLKPRWVVWENVPGVLSDDGGRTFGTVLGILGQLGYGFAYRILDAQYFGVPQRRRRVFVVGCLGSWQCAAAVLFERESLRGYPAPSREAGEGFTHDLAPSLTSSGRGVERSGESRGQDPVVAMCLNGKGGSGRIDGESETFIAPTLRAGKNSTGGDRPPGTDVDTCDSLIVTVGAMSASCSTESKHGHGWGQQDWESGYVIPILEAGARTGTSTDDIRAGIGIGEPDDPMFTLQSGKQHAVAFNWRGGGNQTSLGCNSERTGSLHVGQTPAVAFHENQRHEITLNDTAGSLKVNGGKPGQGYPAAMIGSAVRRLTPEECEALQGFSRGYTKVPYRGKPAADGPRYAAIGNSFAVPVVSWIGQRIDVIESRGLAHRLEVA